MIRTTQWKERLQWLTHHPGKEWQGKDYEYVARKVDNHFEIFRRKMELDEWKLYTRLVVIDDIIFVNKEGLDDKFERYYDTCKRFGNR